MEKKILFPTELLPLLMPNLDLNLFTIFEYVGETSLSDQSN